MNWFKHFAAGFIDGGYWAGWITSIVIQVAVLIVAFLIGVKLGTIL